MRAGDSSRTASKTLSMSTAALQELESRRREFASPAAATAMTAIAEDTALGGEECSRAARVVRPAPQVPAPSR